MEASSFFEHELIMTKNRKQRGLSLVEAGIGLSLVTLIAAAGIFFFSMGREKANYEVSIQYIDSIRSAISTWKSSRADYSTLTSEEVVNTGLLDTAITAGVSIVFRGGHTVLLDPVDWCAGCNNGYSLTISDLPASSCVKYATLVLDNGHIDTWVRSGSDNSTNQVNPTDLAPITNFCTTDSRANDVILRFY